MSILTVYSALAQHRQRHDRNHEQREDPRQRADQRVVCAAAVPRSRWNIGGVDVSLAWCRQAIQQASAVKGLSSDASRRLCFTLRR
jgi:hypothetical protein